ncbi:alanine racemase [Candidatus Dependentiae bacterium]|nr:alanine racemase [Candidatus Dependentiae bacterium]
MNTSPLSWIEISKNALDHNINQYKQALGSKQLAAVIKSDAYGHGQLLIAQIYQNNRKVSWLCVSNLSEALFLRNHGITKPILVLGHIDAPLDTIINKNIAFICYEKDLLEHANTVGSYYGASLPIHLKIDTGLSRFGLSPEKALDFIGYAHTLPHITLQGIFTHFAQSQHEDQAFTIEQHRIFTKLLEEITSSGIKIPIRHCANSAAATLLDDDVCTLARIGIGLYGIWPSEAVYINTQTRHPDFNLKHVASWKTRITHIRTLPAGITIGYDRTFTIQQPTRIALLPVGYYEGYDRRHSNNGSVIIRNSAAPVLGRVCMNVTMIDITGIPQAITGDTVFLLADHPGVTPHELAQRIQSFNPREILTRIHKDIPRMIVD